MRLLLVTGADQRTKRSVSKQVVTGLLPITRFTFVQDAPKHKTHRNFFPKIYPLRTLRDASRERTQQELIDVVSTTDTEDTHSEQDDVAASFGAEYRGKNVRPPGFLRCRL